MSDDPVLFIVDIDSKAKRPVKREGIDVCFPDDIRGWAAVMDCRHEPYTELELDELIHRCHHAHKQYVLVSEEQLQ